MGVKEQAEGPAGHPVNGVIVVTESWKEHAACKGVDINTFFSGTAAKVNAVERYCSKCLVSDLCLNEAMTSTRVFGIWGGTTHRDRLRMRKWENVRLH